MLEASRAVIALFVRERRSDFSVKELAAEAGLSERTFYRYFPRKEDAIRPYVDAGLARLVSDVRAASRSRPLREALVEAHAAAFHQGGTGDLEALLPVLHGTESLRAVWLQVVTDAEVAFARVVAERLGLPPDSVQARLAGAVLVTAGRLAMEQPFAGGGRGDPGEVFSRCLALLGPTLFEPPARAPRPGPRTRAAGGGAGPRGPRARR
jgi:AcrR family transcriptional regulator